MPSTGLVVGRFAPLHHGHSFVLDMASRSVDRLIVVLYGGAECPLPIALRRAWTVEAAPNAIVVELPREVVDASALRECVAEPIDSVFGSSPRDEALASDLDARFVPVDPARVALPASSRAIALDPYANWHSLPRFVRAHYARRVCLFGPESTGKTSLAARLASHFQTVVVPDHARALLERQAGQIVRDDIDRIARGQLAAEDALARSANRLLVCDTDALTSRLWSEHLFGDCPAWIAREAATRSYDLTLLCDVDVPWVWDEIRYMPDDRGAFFERCEAALQSAGRRYVRVRGDWDERFARAVEAIAEIDPRLPIDDALSARSPAGRP